MSRVEDGSDSALIESPAPESQGWPRDVELIISALQAGENHDYADPTPRTTFAVRHLPRMDYRVRATLKLYSDIAGTGPWRLYTRDANARGLGFLTPHRLPLGYGGTVELRAPTGDVVTVPCTLLRCREVASGWFDGALCFNRDQAMFEVG
jgi:hypothetical protein